MRFEWDEVKAAANLAKHAVDFEDAIRVFDDPLHRSRQDRHEGGEERWQTIGIADGMTLLLVAHTFRIDDDADEVCRIIFRAACHTTGTERL